MLDRLERLIRPIAIPNLTGLLIAAQVAVYLGNAFNPGLVDRLVLIPDLVLAGEVYRLLSFLIVPPATNIIFAFFFWYLFYIMGTALEMFWGTARYNLFLLIGYVGTVSVAFLTPDQPASNWFLQGTVFLAFAHLNPRFTLHLMAIFPIEIRWLALVIWIFFFYGFVTGTWSIRLSIAASVLNFIWFFAGDIANRLWLKGRKVKRKAATLAMRRDQPYFHKCTICGITDADDNTLDFRYCSKCVGDYCYCPTHLNDHEHILEDGQSPSSPNG